MAVHASHAALPYPIKGARYTMKVPMLDADGDPTAPTTPDTEISEDNAAATDAAEEVAATSGMDGMGMITFTGAETDCSCLAVNFKAASGPKATLATLYPRALASIGTGTLSAGSAGGGTLGTILAYDVTGCFIKTTGGTGGGGTGGANNQVRKIATYTTSTGAFTVVPNWETTPDATTTYELLLPEGVTLGMLRTLNPATAGRTVVVDAAGLVDANAVKVGPSGSGTAQTAGDIIGDTNDIQSRLPAALVGGKMDSNAATFDGETDTTFIGAIADAVLDELLSGHTAAGSLGERVGRIPNVAAGAAGGLFIAGSNAATTISSLTVTNATTLSGAVAFGSTFDITGNVGWAGTWTVTGLVEFLDRFALKCSPGGDRATFNIYGSAGAVTKPVVLIQPSVSAPAGIVGILFDLLNGGGFGLQIAGSGSRLLPTGSIGAAEVADGTIDTGAIADGAITAAKLASDAVTAAKLAADVTTELQSGLATAASITSLDAKVGTPSNLGGGATLAGNLQDIEAQTDDIGAAGAGLTALATAAQATAIEADTQDIQARLPAALTAGGNIKADSLAIDGSTEAATRIKRSGLSVATGTVGAASTTTSVVTSSISPAASVTDQFKAQILAFDKDTATAALRGQKTDITASSAGGLLTVTALTTAPANGDTFTIQ